MSNRPVVVIFFNDWKVYPSGVNAGGGESATLALARAIARLGYRVIACANLADGQECSRDGVEFWNFGPTYALNAIERRLRDIGPYYCFAATLAHPFLVLRDHEHCLSRVIINHSPSPYASGLEPTTVMELVDYVTCVSQAQKDLILSVNDSLDSERMVVVRNGFDPEVFSYAGPEGRDWNQIVFIGRLEQAKGIHVLLATFGELKKVLPDLKLSVFGSEGYWPDFSARKQEFVERFPGLVFHGKVPQRELAAHLRRAGLLVFPSVSFESAGLAVVDAQASGCPVVAFNVGGVGEYLKDGELGVLVKELDAESLYSPMRALLENHAYLTQMSRRCEVLGRERPWSVVAQETVAVAERAASRAAVWSSGDIDQLLPESVRRISDYKNVAIETLFDDHNAAALPRAFSDRDLQRALTREGFRSWPHLIKGLRLEMNGCAERAAEAYAIAASHAESSDWQAFFRLAVLCADMKDVTQASRYAREVLVRVPQFPLRRQLEQLIAVGGHSA